AWASVFSRAGHTVVLYDAQAKALDAALPAIEIGLASQREAGLISEDVATIMQRVSVNADLKEALRGAVLAQENIREAVEAKQAIFALMDEAADPDTILASSTSGIPASSFTENLKGRSRCLVGHPINPPSVVPLVELIPAPWTD